MHGLRWFCVIWSFCHYLQPAYLCWTSSMEEGNLQEVETHQHQRLMLWSGSISTARGPGHKICWGIPLDAWCHTLTPSWPACPCSRANHLHQKTVPIVYSGELKTAKAKHKRLEKQWRKMQLIAHRQIVVEQRNLVTNLCQEAKKAYYQDRLCLHDRRELYSVANELLHRDKANVLPTRACSKVLAAEVSDYFGIKISAIRSKLQVPQS